MNAPSPCRAYIVYHNGLFAQAVRSLLEKERGVAIVGMESDVTRAKMAVRTLRPDVILVEEPVDHALIWPCLEAAGASRIVTFSLGHVYATVFDTRRTEAGNPLDLIKAVQGERTWEEVQGSPLGSQDGTASTTGQPERDRGCRNK
jgi:DNA-binding NarL/FixJ family response regulator